MTRVGFDFAHQRIAFFALMRVCVDAGFTQSALVREVCTGTMPALLRKRLERARKEGDLPKSGNTEILAKFVCAVLHDMAVQAKAGFSFELPRADQSICVDFNVEGSEMTKRAFDIHRPAARESLLRSVLLDHRRRGNDVAGLHSWRLPDRLR